MDRIWWAFIVGGAATLMLDLWTILRRRIFATPLPSYALVGRWFAHMPRGRFRHRAISQAAPVTGEGLVGWLAHYAIGIMFAGLLPAIWGGAWMQSPTIWPALIVGVATVAAPLLVMQPAMGTAKPLGSPQWRSAASQSLITHTVFGFGLYCAALLASVSGMNL